MTSRSRPVGVLVLALLLAYGAAGPAAAGVGASHGPTAPAVSLVRDATPSGRYSAPLPRPLHVLTAFDPPATPYGPGHLGVDLAAVQGAGVYSAGPGTVVFAGQVAGRGVVVVAHPDGIRTEYEPVDAVVTSGIGVSAGTLLGRIAGQHAACAPASCLHWGARRGDTYLNPLDLLRALGPVRLLPWTG